MQFTDAELEMKQERANIHRREAKLQGLELSEAWNDGYAHAIADLRQIGRLREFQAADKICIGPNSESGSSASSSV